MRLLACLLAAAPLMALDLSPKLAEWRVGIERQSGIPVLITEVQTGADGREFRLAEDTPRREFFAQYLSRPDFTAQFRLMHAVMVHHRQPSAEAFLIMVNGARRAEFEGYEDAVIGHELGHAQLKAQRYPAPRFLPGISGCLAISTGDVVQHILIRAEMDRRGIAREPFWIKSLDEAAQAMTTGSALPPEDRCARVRQAAQLIDVRLGLPVSAWPGRERYEALVAKLYPEVIGPAGAVVAYLEGRDVSDKAAHHRAVEFIFGKLKDLAVNRPSGSAIQNRYPVSGRVSEACANLNMDPGEYGSELYASAWGFPFDSRHDAVQYTE